MEHRVEPAASVGEVEGDLVIADRADYKEDLRRKAQERGHGSWSTHQRFLNCNQVT
jgi:hypothetical protein